MANNLGITEVALAVLCDKTAAHNLFTTRENQQSKTLVVRVLGHEDDTGAEEDDPNLMALFKSDEMGGAWTKQQHSLKKVTYDCSVSGAGETVATAPTTATRYIANWDFSGGYPE